MISASKVWDTAKKLSRSCCGCCVALDAKEPSRMMVQPNLDGAQVGVRNEPCTNATASPDQFDSCHVDDTLAVGGVRWQRLHFVSHPTHMHLPRFPWQARGRPKPVQDISEAISDYMASATQAQDLRLVARPDGFVRVDVAVCCDLLVRFATKKLEVMVHSSSKQRFALAEVEGAMHVHADQGHSMKAVTDEPSSKRLEEGSPELPPAVADGTYMNNWERIENKSRRVGSMSISCRTGERLDPRTEDDYREIVLTSGSHGVVPQNLLKRLIRAKRPTHFLAPDLG